MWKKHMYIKNIKNNAKIGFFFVCLFGFFTFFVFFFVDVVFCCLFIIFLHFLLILIIFFFLYFLFLSFFFREMVFSKVIDEITLSCCSFVLSQSSAKVSAGFTNVSGQAIAAFVHCILLPVYHPNCFCL